MLALGALGEHTGCRCANDILTEASLLFTTSCTPCRLANDMVVHVRSILSKQRLPAVSLCERHRGHTLFLHLQCGFLLRPLRLRYQRLHRQLLIDYLSNVLGTTEAQSCTVYKRLNVPSTEYNERFTPSLLRPKLHPEPVWTLMFEDEQREEEKSSMQLPKRGKECYVTSHSLVIPN